MNITLKQLRYVDALARHGHFGQAADACAISQPALSMQIKELEALIGQPLFERGSRQVRLTGFGEQFHGRAAEILNAVEDLSELARAASDKPDGPLRLGIIPTIAPYLLPRLLPKVSTEYPTLDLFVRESLTQRLVTELREGRLDAAILALPLEDAGFAERPLFTESFVLIRPKADQSAADARESLAANRLLLLEDGHCLRDQALSFCQTSRGTGQAGLDGTSLATLVQMVGAGLGVTLIPRIAVSVETRAADVDVLPFTGQQPERHVGMIWRKTTPLAKQLHQIAETICAVHAAL